MAADKTWYNLYISPSTITSIVLSYTYREYNYNNTLNKNASGYFDIEFPDVNDLVLTIKAEGYKDYIINYSYGTGTTSLEITMTEDSSYISKLSIDGSTYEIKDATARTSISELATVATTGSYNDLNNKPTIPTVNNATLTIQKNGTTVNTFTANASSNVTANITVPTTTTSVTSGSTAALTSGGAYTNLVRRYSTSSATGSSTQGVYVNAFGQIQPCTAVTSTYSSTGTAPVNGKAIASAISTKQNTLVSGTNIKTINGNSLLGSGDLTIAIKNVRDGSTLPIWHGTEQQWNQGGSSTWYYWQTSTTALWTASTLPSSANWMSVTYGDGKFVAVAGENSDKAAYSTDGINWTTSTLPSSIQWSSVTYGDGKFVTVASGSNKAAYSTDGINWTETTLPSSTKWQSVTYGNGKFVAVTYTSSKSAYSTDGINWTASTLPSSAAWTLVTYGDGKFVTVASGSNKAAYSTDGINWTETTLPSSTAWASVTHGDGKFVTVGNGFKSAYSTDGINWTASTLPSSVSWQSVTYGDGKFVAVSWNSNKSAYSTDGINWTASTMPSSAYWALVTYGDGKFVAVTYNSDASAIFTIQYDKCYTLDSTPTTSTQVYSAPETASSYTISSVTSGAITLSNNNTYYYTQGGNAFTYRTIGDTHPEYLAFIDGVGIKMGNMLIATATPITTSITSTSTDTEVPSAKAVYDEVGDVESVLNTINSGGNTVTVSIYVYGSSSRVSIATITIGNETFTNLVSETTYTFEAQVGESYTLQVQNDTWEVAIKDANGNNLSYNASATASYTFTASEDITYQVYVSGNKA